MELSPRTLAPPPGLILSRRSRASRNRNRRLAEPEEPEESAECAECAECAPESRAEASGLSVVLRHDHQDFHPRSRLPILAKLIGLMPYIAEASGYLSVELGHRINVLTTSSPGDASCLFGHYVFAESAHGAGWIPLEVVLPALEGP